VPDLDSSAPLPLATVIAATVALDDALGRGHFPQARHHARVIALRADGNGLPEVASGARGLMVALDAIRPERAVWVRSLDQLHFASDRALDTPAAESTS